MTFVEAAIAILQREGKPLHFKQLTEIALKENLLTVVGRTPEATMQQRLNDAIRKDASLPFTRDKPGVFGLRHYPDPPPVAPPVEVKVEATPTPPSPVSSDGAPGEAKGDDRKRRRRRGARGRKRHEGGAVGEPGGAGPVNGGGADLHAAGGIVDDEEVEGDEDDAVTVAATPAAAPRAIAAPPAVEPERMSFAIAAAQVAAAHGRVAPAARNELAVAAMPPPSDAGAESSADTPPESTRVAAALPHPAPPRAPARPAVEPPREALPLDRPVERAAERLAERVAERPAERVAERHEASYPVRASLPGEAVEAGAPESPASDGEARGQVVAAGGAFADAAVDVLRAGDGRPANVRQIVDIALKRKLVRGEPQELWRLMRVALIADQRAREAAGQRSRARPVGAGHFVVSDRRLDGELAQYEKDVADRAARLSEATRVALHRRVARLAPPAFEALARVVLGRLGVTQIELVKRGDGVGYFGGELARGAQRVKLLIGVRAGEGELKRRAVGELRAGLKARGFEEGLLLAAGRAGQEVLTELPAGAALGHVELYDGDALAAACVRLGVGVVRRHVPVDTIDLELFNELTET